MTFAFPQLLWLLLVPLALFAWDFTRRRAGAADTHPKILRAEAGSHSLRLSTLNPQLSTRRARARPWLCLGLAFCLIAAARPQWGRIEEPVFDQAREILIAIDLSRSMLTPDVKPSRLDRAKLLTQALLERLTGERVGLVVFSGTAFLQSPLSADYEILREFLPALNPDFLPEGGTNYRALIDTSLSAFGSTAAADRFLIVLSDGEATEDNWRERVPELKKKGIRVLGLGVGTPAGAMIPDGSGGLVKDERGAVVLSKLEPATLHELASATGGVYEDASNWIDLAKLIDATVEAGRKGQFTEKNTVRLVERFQWPLALGVWFLLVSLYYEFPVRPRPREIKLTEPAPRPTPASTKLPAAVALALLAFVIRHSSLAATVSPSASSPAKPPEPPALARIVTRLAAADHRTARDWAELGRETVSWGSRLQSEQQPIPEGPVRDALAAVDLGEKADPKTADWPRLREELEALLKKSQDQKQQQQQQQKQPQNQQDKPDQQQNQSQDQKNDPQQKQDEQKKQDQSQPQQQQKNGQPQSSKSDQQKSEQDQKNQPKPGQQKSSDQSAFGDMKEQPPAPPPQETQKVGGVPEKKDGPAAPADPALALPLQKLDQLKNQDSPAELFKLMEADKDQKPRTNKKDW